MRSAGTFTPSRTELGGKDPLVRADAKMSMLPLTGFDWTGDVNRGAMLAARIERFMCTKACMMRFVEKAVAWVNALNLGIRLDTNHRHRPMPTCVFAAEVRAQISEAVAPVPPH